MALKEEVAQWDIKDWSVIKSTYRPFEGEIVYLDTVITGQLNIVSVIGDGTNYVSGLYFKETLEISTNINADIQSLRIAGNRIKIFNSGSSTISIEIGITAASLTFYLLAGKEVNLFFNGTVWMHKEENVITMTDANLALDDLSGPARVIFPSSGITANRTVTLPTLADNQNQKIRFDNMNTTYALYIDGEGAETIETSFTIINLSTEYCVLEGNSSTWKRIDYTPVRPIYHYQDEKTAGTNGGASVATTWTKRTCDDEVKNTIIGASNSSSVHTLPPGEYKLTCKSPFYRVGELSIRFRNTDDSTNAGISINDYANITNGNSVLSINDERFTITAEKDFELQYYVATAVATNGLGVTNNNGIIDIYSEVILEKLI